MNHPTRTLAAVLAATVLAGVLSPAASVAGKPDKDTAKVTAAKAPKGGTYAVADGRKNR